MRLPESFIQEVKERNDISDVVSSYMTLKRSGRYYKGLCPFHGEKTPSFVIYPENGSFYCFGCNTGGDVITFIRLIENLDYVESVKFLAQRAGIAVPQEDIDDSAAKLRQRIYEANREAARFYNSRLYTEEGRAALDYLIKRRLTKKTITHFGLGFAPASRFALVNHLRSLGFTDTELVTANLANNTRSGKTIIDRYDNRVMFPIIDVRGNVIGFGGRRLSKDQKAKYINTSDTPVFNKSRNLYSLNNAKKSGSSSLLLCEGYMDVIAVNQAGITNAVATLGTALTQEQALLMKRYADEVIICYDADQAGMNATQRAIPILRNTGLIVRVLRIPDGKDPDEFLKINGEMGPAAFKKLIQNSGNDIDYRLNRLRTQFDMDSMQGKVDYLNAAVKMLSAVDNPMERDLYVSKISEEVGVDKSSIKEQLDSVMNKKRRSEYRNLHKEIVRNSFGQNDRVNTEHRENIRAVSAEEAIISFMIQSPENIRYIIYHLGADDFVTSFNRRVFEYIVDRHKAGKPVDTRMSEDFTIEEYGKIVEIINRYKREFLTRASVDEYIKTIKEESGRMSAEQIGRSGADDFDRFMKQQKEKRK